MRFTLGIAQAAWTALLLPFSVVLAGPASTTEADEWRPPWDEVHAHRYPDPLGSYHRDRHYFSEVASNCALSNQINEMPQVDCHYTWEHWHNDNHLQYRVHVAGSNTMKWHDLCNSIYDNVKDTCQDGADCDNLLPSCWCDRRVDAYPGDINGTVYHGYQFFFPMRRWAKGEDNVKCVTEAITKALCSTNVLFVNGQCYKREGSQIHGL